MSESLDILIASANLVCRWIRVPDGHVFNNDAGTLDFEDDTSWANSLKTVTQDTVANRYPWANIKPAAVGEGLYDIVFYDIAAPVSTTQPAFGYRVKIDEFDNATKVDE